MSTPAPGDIELAQPSSSKHDPIPKDEATPEVAPEEPSAIMKCIWKIPICGGFCAPTNSTEKSCLRHFSNQDTPPQPCLNTYLCRRFWEHPLLCRWCGRVGLAWGDRNRSSIMLVAFIMSFISWIFCFVALAAVSSNTSVIKDVAWAKGTTVFDSNSYPPSGATVESWIGLNYRVDVTTPVGGVETTKTVSWDDAGACVMNGITFPGCTQCSDTATEAISWMIVTVITQIFQITTDLQRTTRYGDLNCQKMMGTITSLFGAFSTLQSLRGFMEDCANKDNFAWFDDTTQSTYTPAGVMSTSSATFKAGPGFVLLFVAIVLKLFDAACHMMVPIPEEKSEFEPIQGCQGPSLEEYMARCKDERFWAKPVDPKAAPCNVDADISGSKAWV